MKKLLLTMLAIGLAGQTMGQFAQGLTEKPIGKTRASNLISGTQQANQPESTGSIWSSDFSVPSQWTISNAAGNNDNWVIRTTGPAGQFPIPAIASPSASNGFALFDSDSLCSGNQNASITTATPINLSAHNNVILRFYQQYRRYFDSSFVELSTNGTTWTRVPFGNLSIANDAFPGSNPNLVQLNVSAIVGGQSTVWVRFRFYSVSSVMGSDAGCGYSWMIDDVSFESANQNDLVLSSVRFESTSTFDFYGTYSTNNVAGDSLYAFARFSNNGALAQPNTRLTVSAINASGNTVASQTVVYGSLAPAAADSIRNAGLPLASMPAGRYRIVAAILSDSTDTNPNDNRDTAYFDIVVDSISQAVRSPRATTSLGTNSFPQFPGAEDDFRCANVLELLSTDTISGVYVKLTQASAGGLIIGHIRPANTIDVPILETDLHVLTVADTTAKVLWLPFLGSLSDRILPAGDYYISVSLFSNTNVNHIRVMDDLTNQRFKKNGSSIIYTADDQTWYNNGIAFAIDATFGASTVSVKDLANQNFTVNQLYPNPSNQSSTLTFELKSAGKAEIVITDMRGRQIQEIDLGKLAIGKHEHQIDVSALNSGLYFVEFRHNGSVGTQKLIVNK